MVHYMLACVQCALIVGQVVDKSVVVLVIQMMIELQQTVVVLWVSILVFSSTGRYVLI